jgi:hypothetical protein
LRLVLNFRAPNSWPATARLSVTDMIEQPTEMQFCRPRPCLPRTNAYSREGLKPFQNISCF